MAVQFNQHCQGVYPIFTETYTDILSTDFISPGLVSMRHQQVHLIKCLDSRTRIFLHFPSSLSCSIPIRQPATTPKCSTHPNGANWNLAQEQNGGPFLHPSLSNPLKSFSIMSHLVPSCPTMTKSYSCHPLQFEIPWNRFDLDIWLAHAGTPHIYGRKWQKYVSIIGWL